MLGAGFAAYSSTAAVAQATEWVAHTHEVEHELEIITSLVKDVETGQRGYILTGDVTYLEPYDAALARLGERIDRLAALTADNPTQQARLGSLRSTVGTRLEIAARVVESERRGDHGAAVEEVATGRGKRAMDAVRAATASMQAEEDRLLASRLDVASKVRRRSTLLAAATSALVLLLVTVVYLSGKWSADAIRRLNAGLERRVVDRTRALVDANEQLERFSYTVSHDLRAPLRGIQGFAQALEEDHGPALDVEARSYLARIVGAARRMEQLIQDLLDYGRIARQELALGPLALEKIVDEVVVNADAEIARVRAKVEVARPIPPVVGHPVVLRQVVANLVANALKFSRPGVPPRVGVTSELRHGEVELSVRDEGIGIAPEHRARIFEVFERLHGQEAYGGTGVGLAIVKKGVERMGGRCGVESELGRGSRFWIVLPAAPSAETSS